MITIKKLVDCSLAEAVTAWNQGFEGYFINATTTPEKFITRMFTEDLSPSLSIIAFENNVPIGIVMTGLRIVDGKKIAWNGGTGVSKEYRGKGIGKLLIEANLLNLKEESVSLATLEAISENKNAISLYIKMGYVIEDTVEFLTLNGKQRQNPIREFNHNYTVERAAPQQVGQLPFYKATNPWQTRWQSAKIGEGIIVKDDRADVLGYAYYHRIYNDQGEHTSTTMYQCEPKPGADTEEIIHRLAGTIFGDFNDDIKRTVPNLPINKSEKTYSVLKQIGFQTTAQQVYMLKEL